MPGMALTHPPIPLSQCPETLFEGKYQWTIPILTFVKSGNVGTIGATTVHADFVVSLRENPIVNTRKTITGASKESVQNASKRFREIPAV